MELDIRPNAEGLYNWRGTAGQEVQEVPAPATAMARGTEEPQTSSAPPMARCPQAVA